MIEQQEVISRFVMDSVAFGTLVDRCPIGIGDRRNRRAALGRCRRFAGGHGRHVRVHALHLAMVHTLHFGMIHALHLAVVHTLHFGVIHALHLRMVHARHSGLCRKHAHWEHSQAGDREQ